LGRIDLERHFYCRDIVESDYILTTKMPHRHHVADQADRHLRAGAAND
jgi:hypothetical protein